MENPKLLKFNQRNGLAALLVCRVVSVHLNGRKGTCEKVGALVLLRDDSGFV